MLLQKINSAQHLTIKIVVSVCFSFSGFSFASSRKANRKTSRIFFIFFVFLCLLFHPVTLFLLAFFCLGPFLLPRHSVYKRFFSQFEKKAEPQVLLAIQMQKAPNEI